MNFTHLNPKCHIPKKIVKAILTGSKNYDIDFTQKWCLYNKGKKLFRTANKPADFLENDTDKYALANDLLENKEMLKYLRFTKNEITNFKKAKKARRMEWEVKSILVCKLIFLSESI